MNNGKFVSAANAGANPLIAQSDSIGAWESFTVGFVSGVPPTVPNGLMATAAGNSQVGLTWAASSGATGYNVKYSTNSGGPYTVLASNVMNTSYTVTGLANGTTYFFVVSALNPAGESANSLPASAAPGSLNRIEWVASSSTSGSDSPGNAIDGNLSTRWSTGAFQVNGQWFQVDMGAVNTFYKIVLNAANSPSDYPRGYQVNVSNDGINWGSPVTNEVGTSAITTITFPTQAARYIRITQTLSAAGSYWSIHEIYVFGTSPTAPAGLTATAAGSQVNLSWNASADATGYNLKRSIVSGGSYTTIGVNLAGLAYTDTDLTNGTTYYYVVSATNSFGESANSTEASAQPVSTVPVSLNFAASGGQIQLSWPMDHLGWRLETQTNAPGVGIGTNWVTVADSTATNQIFTPVNPTSGSVFFRLVYP